MFIHRWKLRYKPLWNVTLLGTPYGSTLGTISETKSLKSPFSQLSQESCFHLERHRDSQVISTKLLRKKEFQLLQTPSVKRKDIHCVFRGQRYLVHKAGNSDLRKMKSESSFSYGQMQSPLS